MWKKFKKTSGRSPSPKTYQDHEMKVIGWCLSNNISISCTPDWKNNGTNWLIDIKINKKTYTDPSTYTDEAVLNKIYEYYKYYYDKHRK